MVRGRWMKLTASRWMPALSLYWSRRYRIPCRHLRRNGLHVCAAVAAGDELNFVSSAATLTNVTSVAKMPSWSTFPPVTTPIRNKIKLAQSGKETKIKKMGYVIITGFVTLNH